MIASVALVILFSRLSFRPLVDKVICILSPCSFSVYLIHDNPLVRNNIICLFEKYVGLSAMQIFLCVLGSAVAIYIFCFIVDMWRELIFKVCKINKLGEWKRGK